MIAFSNLFVLSQLWGIFSQTPKSQFPTVIDLDLEQGSWEVIYGRHKFKKYTLFTHQIESDALVRFWIF